MALSNNGFFPIGGRTLGFVSGLHRATELSQKTKQLEQAVFHWLGFLLELGSGAHQVSLKEIILKPPATLMKLILR